MARRGKWAILILSALVAPAPSQEKLEAADLEAWLAKIQPEVEKILGYSLQRFPKIEFPVDKPLEVDAQEIALHLRGRFPHLRAGEPPTLGDHTQWFNMALHVASENHHQTVIARQEEGFPVLVVFPTHHLKMPSWTEALQTESPPPKTTIHNALQGTSSLDFLRLAVAHELVRYALDSRYDLGKMRDACRDAEEWFALQALIEGRAQWVTRHVAHQLHLEEFFPLLAARFLYVPDVWSDPGLRAISQSVVRQKFWAYEQGLAFWNYLDSQGKADEKAVFANPPRQAKLIDHPDAYLRQAGAKHPDLDAVLASLEPQLPATIWASTRQAWTPDMFIQVAGLLNEKARAEKVTQGWEEGRSMIWSWKDNPDCQVALSVVRYETPAGARAYYGFALDLQRKRDELSNQPCGLPLKVIESRTSDIKLTGVEEAIFFEKKMRYVNSKQTLSSHILLVRQEDRVVELTWYGLPADTAWAQRILDVLPK